MIFPFTEEIYNPSVTNVNYKNAIHFLLPLNYLILKTIWQASERYSRFTSETQT